MKASGDWWLFGGKNVSVTEKRRRFLVLSRFAIALAIVVFFFRKFPDLTGLSLIIKD